MKKIYAITSLSILCLLPAVYAFTDTPSANDIIKKVQEKIDKVPLIEALYVQRFHWSLAGAEEEYSGKIYLGENDAFRIETPQQLIVSDGKSVWTHSDVNQQVIIDRLDPDQGNYLPRHLFISYKKDYAVSVAGEEAVDGRPCYHLTMTSKSRDVFIQKIDVWIDKSEWLTRRLSYLDVNENITDYTIKEILLKTGRKPDLFQYKEQAGVEVVDLR